MKSPTGRWATPSQPNIQNIPIRTAEGDRIRAAFIAGAGSVPRQPSGTPAPVEPAPATPIADGGAGAPVGTRTGRWKMGKSNIEEVEK